MKTLWWQCVVLLFALVLTPTAQAQDELEGAANPAGAQDPPAGEQDGGFDTFGVLGQPSGPTEEQQLEIDQLNTSAAQKAQQGDVEGALNDYENALQVAPNFVSYLESGRLFREQKDIGRATQNLLQAIQRIRDLPEEQFSAAATIAYRELGLAYLDAQEFNNAIQTFQQAQLIQGQRNNAELIFNQGLAQAEFALNQQFSTAQTRSQDLQAAIPLFDRAITLAPNYADAYYERGTANFMLGNLDDAMEDLEKAVQLDPNNPEMVAQYGAAGLRRALGESQARNGDAAQIESDLNIAIDQYAKFLQLIPTDKEQEEELELEVTRESGLISRSAALIALGDERGGGAAASLYREAVADADAALEIVPALPDAHFQKGMAYRMLGELDQAVEEFSEALQASPGNAEGLLRRGIVYYRQGDIELAKSDFVRAIRYSPDSNPRAHFWLGLSFLQEGDDVRAIHEFTRAIRYQPFYTLAYLNRGLAQMRRGRFHRAVEDFNQVLRSDGSHTKARALRDQALQLRSANG